MMIGYARVSSGEQNLDLQIDALTAAGCERIFTDKISSGREDRPGLRALLEVLEAGDVVTIWKIDRLSRSVSHFLEMIASFRARSVELRSLNETLDTRTPTGAFTTVILSAVAALERDVLRQRTRAGIEAAKLRGRVGGRPRSVTDEQLEMARHLLRDPENSVAAVCRSLGIAKSSFYRITKENNPGSRRGTTESERAQKGRNNGKT